MSRVKKSTCFPKVYPVITKNKQQKKLDSGEKRHNGNPTFTKNTQ